MDISKRLIVMCTLFLLITLDGKSQCVYPSYPITAYYNMDTSKIKIGESPLCIKYSDDGFPRITEDSMDAYCGLSTMSYEDIPCSKFDNIQLPLMKINNKKMGKIVSRIISKTLAGDYSPSPDSLISRGICFLIMASDRLGNKTDTVGIKIEVLSNYYLGSCFEQLQRFYPTSNFFCCYHNGILGIIMFWGSRAEENIKCFFSEMDETVTLHLYKKQCEIINYNHNMDKKEPYATNYGLYRRYVITKNGLKTYSSTN